MSQQSINSNTLDKFSRESKEILIYNTENYFYDKNFKLGSGANIEEMTYYRHLRKMLCDSDCEIQDLIYKKLNGELTKKPNRLITRLSDIVQLMELERQCSQEEVIQKIYWTDVAW